MSKKKRVIVIGNGMVGYKFCEALLERGGGDVFDITVFGDEPSPAYDRVHLTQRFSGVSESDLLMAGLDWYQENGICLELNARASEIDRGRRIVRTEDGRDYRYEFLVLATGSFPFVPPVPGKDKAGVFVYRTFQDVAAITSWAGKSKRAAVVGGGLLGLEAAKALYDLGLETHVLEFAPRLMPRQLDDKGAALLAEKIRALGVYVHLQKSASEIAGTERVERMLFGEGDPLEVDMVVFSAGIRPRDELARLAGIEVGERGGITVDDAMRTSDTNIYAIGECALHGGMVYGLVGPGYQMAEVAAANLLGGNETFKGASLDTQLKLMGVDVASFGDAFNSAGSAHVATFEDTRAGIYKKLVLDPSGERLIGGVLVGEAADFPLLSGLSKGSAPLSQPLESLLIGQAAAGGMALGPAALPDEAQVCSCNNVTKGQIVQAICDGGLTSPAQVKTYTKAGTGCGGCMPLVTNLLNAELKASGKSVNTNLCEHFEYSRQELFDIVRVKKIKTFEALLASHGHGDGCEICKPAVASILASLWNEMILDHHDTLQDTNDRFLANIQRGGTYSVIPRIPGGEITPEKLIVLGEVAKKYDLYCKITGGQRIDLLGARVEQLPDIWKELVEAGFESGHAYGKALRTVKSCVGSTWCRYGQQDSTAMAIRLEERYRGIRAPHKIKSAVSGCIRECAEAQGKDFGVIATENGWNLYVCGNGGANPRHADLLATDIDDETLIQYVDRFLMYYIRTADKLTRTSVWLEGLDGGIEKLKSVVIDDSLGISADLEADMERLVASYKCEWAEVVNDPEKQKRFRHFANDTSGDPTVEFTEERHQKRPADWAENRTLEEAVISGRERWQWQELARAEDVPANGGVSVKYGDAQIAVFNFASRGEWYATQNMCPHRGQMALARGLIGDAGGVPKLACPFHKKTFSMKTGECLSGDDYQIQSFPVKIEAGAVLVQLPPAEELHVPAVACAKSRVA